MTQSLVFVDIKKKHTHTERERETCLGNRQRECAPVKGTSNRRKEKANFFKENMLHGRQKKK